MTPEEQAGENLRRYASATPASGNGAAPAGQVTPDAKGQPAVVTGSKRKLDPVRALVGAVKTACNLVNYAGAAYAVPKRGSAWAEVIGTPGIAQAFGGPLRRKIVRLAGIHPDVGMIGHDIAEKVSLNLEAEAFDEPETSLGLRFYHLPNHPLGERIYLDLGRTDSKCIEIKPSEWTVLDHPSDGVVFRRSLATRALPLPERDGRLDKLADLLALTPDSDEFKLISGWALGLPLAASVRPGLLLTGPPGTGKSTRLRLATSLWEPSNVAALGSTFGNNHNDDQVRALHRTIPLWDNLTAVSGNTSDLLCCLITGTSLEGRRLYSNAEMDSNPIHRPVGLTAVGVPAGLRPDAMDRLIVVEVPPLAQRIEDAELQARFDRAHPQLLGAACEALAAALAWRTKVAAPTQYRMAAHARTLSALDAAIDAGELTGCPSGLLATYDKALREARQRTVAEDAFGGPLIAWLAAQPPCPPKAGVTRCPQTCPLQHRRTGTQEPPQCLRPTGPILHTWDGRASELLDEISRHRFTVRAFDDPRGTGWPRSARAVPVALAHLRDGLAALGITWTTRLLDGTTRYTFTLRDQSEGSAGASTLGAAEVALERESHL